MAHQVMWQTACFTDADGKDHYIRRGDVAPDWVDEYTLFALTSSGALQVVDDPPESVKPSQTETSTSSGTSPDTDSGDLTRPSAEDPKSAWVDWASDTRNPNRVTRDQANGMTKSALMGLGSGK